MQTVSDIRARLSAATKEELGVMERALCADTRKGVVSALEVARKRIKKEEAENRRIQELYSFETEVANGRLVVGLDEVGRGSVAGPLAVGAVVLPHDIHIPGLNDSKQIAPEVRIQIAEEIKNVALAWTVSYIQAKEIDLAGMSASLRMAFMRAVSDIESQGVIPEIILLDGNPLSIDEREINIVKGDARCASIAAASIVAKVERDQLMCELGSQYPFYGFESCKGYASADHIAAIQEHGLCPEHRESFCHSFLQESLF